MANQRMAGGNDFQQKMKQAANGPGGQSHKTSAPSLIGADAWDRQVGRESAQFNNAAVSGSRGAENIAAYANVSKSATAANGNFSINQGNKWVNSSRDQSNVNKEQNAGFSDQRRDNSVNYANQQQDKNIKKSEGFAMGVTNQFINNAKDHREDNTAKATSFADRTVDKYIQKNKDTQAINVAALDQSGASSAAVSTTLSQKCRGFTPTVIATATAWRTCPAGDNHRLQAGQSVLILPACMRR